MPPWKAEGEENVPINHDKRRTRTLRTNLPDCEEQSSHSTTHLLQKLVSLWFFRFNEGTLFTCFDVMKNSSTAFTLCSPRPRLTYRQWTGHVLRTYAAMANRLGFSQQLHSIAFSFSITRSWLLVMSPFTFCPKPSMLCTDKFPT